MKKRLPISNGPSVQGEQLQVAENILMFFQQKFCRSISNPDMDRLIVDQLGCMAIARTDNEDKVIFFEILPISLSL